MFQICFIFNPMVVAMVLVVIQRFFPECLLLHAWIIANNFLFLLAQTHVQFSVSLKPPLKRVNLVLNLSRISALCFESFF